MNWNSLNNFARFSSSALLTTALAIGAPACSTPNANLEVEAAAQVVERARGERATDCAQELFQSAETALAEARRMNSEGDADGAKRRALEAQNLAEQAIAASPPGCDEPKVAQEPPPPPDQVRGSMIDIRQIVEPVYFDYNDATIRDDSKEVLSKIAEVLLNVPGQRLEVEGHCDVRGSTEYNLHLGERRAHAVMSYLMKQGVGADQVSIISYGEERPVDLGISEAAHQKNRRAELRPL